MYLKNIILIIIIFPFISKNFALDSNFKFRELLVEKESLISSKFKLVTLRKFLLNQEGSLHPIVTDYNSLSINLNIIHMHRSCPINCDIDFSKHLIQNFALFLLNINKNIDIASINNIWKMLIKNSSKVVFILSNVSYLNELNVSNSIKLVDILFDKKSLILHLLENKFITLSRDYDESSFFQNNLSLNNSKKDNKEIINKNLQISFKQIKEIYQCQSIKKTIDCASNNDIDLESLKLAASFEIKSVENLYKKLNNKYPNDLCIIKVMYQHYLAQNSLNNAEIYLNKLVENEINFNELLKILTDNNTIELIKTTKKYNKYINKLLSIKKFYDLKCKNNINKVYILLSVLDLITAKILDTNNKEKDHIEGLKLIKELKMLSYFKVTFSPHSDYSYEQEEILSIIESSKEFYLQFITN